MGTSYTILTSLCYGVQVSYDMAVPVYGMVCSSTVEIAMAYDELFKQLAGLLCELQTII